MQLKNLLLFGLFVLWVTVGSITTHASELAEGARGPVKDSTVKGVTVEGPAVKELMARELWYQVEIGGAPAGWMMSREMQQPNELMTESVLYLELKRAGASQSIEMKTRFIETLDHRPISAWSEQRLGSQPTTTSYRFNDDGVKVVSAAGERQIAAPEGEWLTPFAAGKAVSDHLERLLSPKRTGVESIEPEDGDLSFEIRTIDPALGLQPVTTRWRLVDRDVRTLIDGAERAASRWRQSPSYAPSLQSTVDVAPSGDPLRSVTPMMGMEMVVILSTKKKALGSQAVSGSQAAGGNQAEERSAPELLVPSFLYPDRKIERPREVRRAVYRLSLEGEMPDLPQTHVQRSEKIEGGARVWVSLDPENLDPENEADEAEAVSPMSAGDRELHLRSTDFLRHEDPLIRQMLVEVLGLEEPEGAEDQDHESDLSIPRLRAEALRRFVSGHLKQKNLDSILATASEAAASGAGDCTEHAVLLAALLRGDGIPSRVVTGVVYAEQFAGEQDFFAYHMWTQAWLGGRWVDLDPTLGADVAFDAAHIALGATAFEDGSSALMDLSAAGPLIGQVSIHIEDLDYPEPID